MTLLSYGSVDPDSIRVVCRLVQSPTRRLVWKGCASAALSFFLHEATDLTRTHVGTHARACTLSDAHSNIHTQMEKVPKSAPSTTRCSQKIFELEIVIPVATGNRLGSSLKVAHITF